MGVFKLSPDAADDIRRIYFYGLEQFGEVQADAYFHGLYQSFQAIADSPLVYPETDIREGYRTSVYQSDVIYYRVQPDFVEIIAVLGRQSRDGWL